MKKFLKILTCFVLMIAVSVALVACGKKEKEPEDNTPKVVITSVATVDELKSAINSTCDEIKLTADIVIDDMLVVTRKVTFNMNGKTISNTSDIWIDTETVDKWSLLSVGENGDVTITGEGKFKAKENDCFAIDVIDGGKLTIENGEFIGNISAVYVFKGSAEIKGGKFSIQQLSDNETDKERFTLNLYDANRTNGTATLKVTGGTFHKFNPANCLAEGPNTNFVAQGYKSTLIDGYYTVTAE